MSYTRAWANMLGSKEEPIWCTVDTSNTNTSINRTVVVLSQVLLDPLNEDAPLIRMLPKASRLEGFHCKYSQAGHSCLLPCCRGERRLEVRSP